jgi:UvrD/REP helicase N-terminal domain
MISPAELLDVWRGVVIAPAGCGKTQFLVGSVKANPAGRVLVLTHTRAGVAAIRARLLKAEVPQQSFRVATLDAWSAWLALRFPKTSGFVPTGTAADYASGRDAATALIREPSFQRLLASTYARLLVDEYQDCGNGQHTMVLALAEAIPTLVLGDPMQRIFTFGPDGLPTWDSAVAAFGQSWDLSRPWRWENAGEGAFGAWILEQRQRLLAGGSVDFSAAPPNVRWIARPQADDTYTAIQFDAVPRKTGETVIVINSSRDREGRHRIARHGYGLSVVERADLPELMSWAARLDSAVSTTRSWQVTQFAHDVMTGIDRTAISHRLNSIRNSAVLGPRSDEDRALLSLETSLGGEGIVATLQLLARPRERVLFRHELFEAMCQTANMATGSRSLMAAALKVVEQRAAEGRILPRRAVGSTLLLKGLEADHAVVFDADTMARADIYVAISRASRALTVVSNSCILPRS